MACPSDSNNRLTDFPARGLALFADFFIKRPVFSTVTSLFIVIAGAVCIPFLPIAQFPQLAPPQVSVNSFYTGANAQAVESAVTTPLEDSINGVEGMRYMTSSSGNDGSSVDHRDFRADAQPRHRGG